MKKYGLCSLGLVFVLLLSSCSVIKDAKSGVNTSEFPVIETKEDINELENIVDDVNYITVNFVDVGQGDSSFIITENNDVILIDTGDKKDANEIITALDNYDFDDIDLMILSHPHADHIRGTEQILNTYKVNTVVMPSYVATSKLYESILDTLIDKNIEVLAADPTLVQNIDGVSVKVLNSDIIPEDCNNSSVISKITYGNMDILYMGDLEKQGEKVLLFDNIDLSAEVLKVGHHGSDTSTGLDFLKKVDPKYAIISVGEDNKYNHPSGDILNLLSDTGVNYYRTDENGTVSFLISTTDIKLVK